MKKLLGALTVIGIAALMTIVASCVDKPEIPQQMTYRGEVPDSIYLRQQDIEMIAELVNAKNAEKDYKQDVNNMMLKVSGTLILLLLGGLMWFLRQMLSTIPKLQGDINKLSMVLSASEQWDKDREKSCEERHEQIERRINKLEK